MGFDVGARAPTVGSDCLFILFADTRSEGFHSQCGLLDFCVYMLSLLPVGSDMHPECPVPTSHPVAGQAGQVHSNTYVFSFNENKEMIVLQP